MSDIATQAQATLDSDAITAAEAKAARILELAKAAGIQCADEEADKLAGVGPARHAARIAVLTLWALKVADKVTPNAPYEVTRAAVAVTVLGMYQSGTGGGWQSPGVGTKRVVPLGELENMLPWRLRSQGGWRRCQACSGPAWDAAAVAAAAALELAGTAPTVPELRALWETRAEYTKLVADVDADAVAKATVEEAFAWISACHELEEVVRRKALLAIVAQVGMPPIQRWTANGYDTLRLLSTGRVVPCRSYEIENGTEDGFVALESPEAQVKLDASIAEGWAY